MIDSLVGQIETKVVSKKFEKQLDFLRNYIRLDFGFLVVGQTLLIARQNPLGRRSSFANKSQRL